MWHITGTQAERDPVETIDLQALWSGTRVEKSIRQLADELKTSHTQIRRVMAELGIVGTSQGAGKPTLLSFEDQQAIARRVNPSALATLPTHSTEVLPPNGYGKRFDMGENYALHIHIHTTNKAQYRQAEQATDANVQALLNEALTARFQQGQEDQEEVDSIIRAAKSRLIEAGIAGLVMGKQAADPAASPQP